MHTHTHMHTRTRAHARVCMHAPQADNHRAKTFGLVFVLKVIQESKDFIRSIDGDSREYSFVKIRFVASLVTGSIVYVYVTDSIVYVYVTGSMVYV